jgi:hypothetical protein
MATRRTHATVQFRRDVVRRHGAAERPDLDDLYQELHRLKQHYIARWNDRGAVLARLMELMETPERGPSATVQTPR